MDTKTRLFIILVLIFTTSCGGSIASEQLSRNKAVPYLTSEKPLVPARLGSINIEPFTVFALSHEYIKQTGETFFNYEFNKYLKSSNLFGSSNVDVINVKVELLSWIDKATSSFQELMEAKVKYEFTTLDNTILLTEEITSKGSGASDFFGPSRAKNNVKICFSNNILSLSEILQDELPRAWRTFVDSKNVTEEDRYSRVNTKNAIVRALPDSNAVELAKLLEGERLHVTGSLPSGWLQVSREGKVLGWVHGSIIRDDFLSAGSFSLDESPEGAPVGSLHSTPIAKGVDSLYFGKYHALVIGNNDYQYLPKLRTAQNDAQALALVLQEKYGFSVRLLTNATRADILRAINDYRRILSNRDNLLIYYAGHGWLDKEADQGYWLPVDASKQDPVNWISNSSITDALRAMDAKHVLVVADSCYSGKLARGIHVTPTARRYYEQILKKKSRTVMASGGLEPVADEGGKGNHSVFASSLIEALNENQGILDATLLFSKIRRPVMVNADQTPEYSDIRKAGHDGGDFLFVPR